MHRMVGRCARILHMFVEYEHLLLSLHVETVVVVIVWYLDLQIYVQSVPITTKVVNSNPADVEVYLIQHYVIEFVSVLRQVGVFLRVLLKVLINLMLDFVSFTCTCLLFHNHTY